MLPRGFGSRQENIERKTSWRGVNFGLVDSATLPIADRLVPRGAGGEPRPTPAPPEERHNQSPYVEDFHPEITRPTMSRSNQDSALLLKLTASAIADAKCLYIDTTYFSFNFGLVPGLWTRVNRALVPSFSAKRHVDEWMAHRGLVQGEFVSVHIRLDDMLSWSPASKECHEKSPGHFRDRLLALMDRAGVGRNMTVAIASQDFKSPCLQAFAEPGAFPRWVEVDLPKSRDRSCWAAQHMQEVLARGAVFLGTARSTFSATVGWIRKYRLGFKDIATEMLDN